MDKPPFWKIWFIASRPKTLAAAAAPVVIGTAMAYGAGGFHLFSALAALFGAVMIQIGTNFANDYFDHHKGADTPERLGPRRALHEGWVTPQAMKMATIVAFALAVLAGCYLVWRGGIPIVIIGLTSILFGILYTAGPFPLAYLGIADIFVLIYFGPVAVGGTYYVQTLTIDWTVLIAGLAPGLFSVGILTVNNLRDIETDSKIGKKTLAVRFGETFARYLYLNCIVIACFIPIFLTQTIQSHFYAGGTPVIILFARPSIKLLFTEPPGIILNSVLAKTGLFLGIYSLLFSIGWIWPQ